MTTANDLIARVKTTLVDPNGTRWSDPRLLEYVNEAQRMITLLKPSSYTKTDSLQLVAGTLQTLPADGHMLIDIVASMGADGDTPGGAISQIDRTILNTSVSSWRNHTASMNTRHYIYDDRAPESFEVYPPQPDPAGYVQMVYAATPPEITDGANELSLPEIYDTPMRYLVLALCYSMQTSAQDLNKAASYEARAQSMVLGRKVTKQEMHPEQTAERTKR